MKSYIQTFINNFTHTLNAVQLTSLHRAIKVLTTVYEQRGSVYLIGNGGSASIASHWANDLNKTILGHNGHESTVNRFQAMSLTDNASLLTAWANDVGYDFIFSEQLKNFLRETDALVAISSSGNSPNIVKAVELAKSQHLPVVALVGFDGGKVAKLADVVIQVPSRKYTIVESIHATLAHLITSYFYDWLRQSDDVEVGF